MPKKTIPECHHFLILDSASQSTGVVSYQKLEGMCLNSKRKGLKSIEAIKESNIAWRQDKGIHEFLEDGICSSR